MDERIDAQRFAVQGVMGVDEEPDFAYTVGLFLHGLPEFIIFGVPPTMAHQLLNHLALSVLDHGVQIEHGTTIDHLIENYETVALAVDDPSEHLLAVFAARGRRSNPRLPIRALQVALPDSHGRMPWHDEYDYRPVPVLSDRPGRSGDRTELADLR